MSKSTSSQRQIRIGVRAGLGSFGEVYRADFEAGAGIRREYAVKLLLPNQDERALAKERLQDEARLLARIAHPCVPQVADLLEIDERLALVIEWIPGSDLQRWTQSGERMPARPLCEVAVSIADALHVAWSTPGESGEPLQLVHRDVKPQNIRITPKGSVKLLDFGIARAEGIIRSARTRTGILVGSLNYMAPESLRMEQVTDAADVFSLGCTLYEVLHHQPLFHSLSSRKRRQLASRPELHASTIERLLEPQAEAHPELVKIIESMVRFDPEERPKASVIAEQFSALRDTLEGPSLRAFCRGSSWETHPPQSGPLTGHVWTLSAHTELEGEAVGALAEPMSPPADIAPAPASSKSETRLGRGAVTVAIVLMACTALWMAVPSKLGPEPISKEQPADIAPAPMPDPVQAAVQPSSEATPQPPEPKPTAQPATRPEPIPRPEPVPEQPMGAFTQEGDPALLEFLQDGAHFSTSPLPAGIYTLRAQFPGQTWLTVGDVEIVEDQMLNVRCRASFMKCTVGTSAGG